MDERLKKLQKIVMGRTLFTLDDQIERCLEEILHQVEVLLDDEELDLMMLRACDRIEESTREIREALEARQKLRKETAIK
jgi:hypothetical protein